MHHNLSMMCCILAEHSYVYHTTSILIRKSLFYYATANDRVCFAEFNKIVSFYKFWEMWRESYVPVYKFVVWGLIAGEDISVDRTGVNAYYIWM